MILPIQSYSASVLFATFVMMSMRSRINRLPLAVLLIFLPRMVYAEALEGLQDTIDSLVLFCGSAVFLGIQLTLYFVKLGIRNSRVTYFLVLCCVMVLYFSVKVYDHHYEEYKYEKQSWEYSQTIYQDEFDAAETEQHKHTIQRNHYALLSYLWIISLFAVLSSVHGIVIDYRRRINS